MTRILGTTVFVSAAALLAATPMLADNTALTPEQNKVLYELKESCSRDAGALFAQLRENHDDAWLGDVTKWPGDRRPLPPGWNLAPQVRYDYENNYSPKFKECFSLVKYGAKPRGLSSSPQTDLAPESQPAGDAAAPGEEWVKPALICRFANTDCGRRQMERADQALHAKQRMRVIARPRRRWEVTTHNSSSEARAS